jgi:hypothetical protein
MTIDARLYPPPFAGEVESPTGPRKARPDDRLRDPGGDLAGSALAPSPTPPRKRGRVNGRRAVLTMTVVATAIALVSSTIPSGAQTSAPAFTPDAEEPDQFPAGAGRDETFYACTACHNFKLVAAQGMNRRQWDDSIDWMIAKHTMTRPDAKDRETILNYLETAFPPRAPAGRGWQNPFLNR